MEGFYHVGFISDDVSKDSGIAAGEIVVNLRQFEHFSIKHRKELGGLGINVYDYLKLIADNFDAIVDNKDGSYKLVKLNKDRSAFTFCMIELTRIRAYGNWKWLITTAEPNRKPFQPGRNGKTIIWEKKR